jgi:putative sterol carrier protein
MPTVREWMDHAKQKIEENKAKAAEAGAVYKFVLHGDDGGTFVLNLADDPGVSECDGDAHCTIKMGVGDFLEMVEGRVDSRMLFFMGKLRVEGDMGLALKLKKLGELAR